MEKSPKKYAPAKSEDFIYTVVGRWQFPLDMLRHDCSEAATKEDQIKIDRFSGEFAPEPEGMNQVSITLIIRNCGRWKPNAGRWESFNWEVLNDHEKNWRDEYKKNSDLRRSGLAKLTSEERKALGI